MSDQRTIIVCEDHPQPRQIYAQHLTGLGHTVLECNTGEQLLQLLRSDQHVDLVFLDLSLPGIQGEEAARKIQTERALPIIVVSLREAKDILQSCLSTPCVMLALSKESFLNDSLPLIIEFTIGRFAQLEQQAEEVAGLRTKLEDRKLVDRAKDFLMEQGVNGAEAYQRIQKLARDEQISISEVCRGIIRSASLLKPTPKPS